MTLAQQFRATMAERRQHERGSIGHEYLTRAARKYYWNLRRIPVVCWGALEKMHEQGETQ